MYDILEINRAMSEHNLTNEKAAVKAGLAARTVSSIRNGEPNIRLPSLEKLAHALGLELIVKLKKKAP